MEKSSHAGKREIPGFMSAAKMQKSPAGPQVFNVSSIRFVKFFAPWLPHFPASTH